MLFVGIRSNWVICKSVFGFRSSERLPFSRGKMRISKFPVLSQRRASGFGNIRGVRSKRIPRGSQSVDSFRSSSSQTSRHSSNVFRIVFMSCPDLMPADNMMPFNANDATQSISPAVAPFSNKSLSIFMPCLRPKSIICSYFIVLLSFL